MKLIHLVGARPNFMNIMVNVLGSTASSNSHDVHFEK